MERTPEEASRALGKSGTLSRPWWYTFSPGWIILGGIVAFTFGKSLLDRGRESRAVERFQAHQAD